MGAVVQMKDQPKNAYVEALVAFGGPVLGSMGALATAAAGIYLDSQLLMALGQVSHPLSLSNTL